MDEGTRIQSHAHKSTMPVIFLFLLIVIGLLIGIYYANKHRAKVIEKEDVLLTTVLLEGRHRQIGPYFSLYGWFEIFIKVENFYYNRYQEYADPAQLDSQFISGIDPTTVLKKIRNDFWEDRLFLDNFIPYDTLKSNFKATFGKNYVNFLTALDSSAFYYEFSLDSNRKSYTIKVFEKKDFNLDNDNKDYFIYKHKGQNPHIRFKDRGEKIALDDFINNYAALLAQNLDATE